MMTPAVRRAALTVHVVCSVGWIGAATAYLSLGIIAGTSAQPTTVRAGWIGMELIGWYVLVPLAALTFLTGLLMSLGTSWGLIRHYWVVIALALTAISFGVLLLHMPAVSRAADLARTGQDVKLAAVGGDIAHPALGLLVLLAITVLNIYKPRGLTTYGQRVLALQRRRRPQAAGRVDTGGP